MSACSTEARKSREVSMKSLKFLFGCTLLTALFALAGCGQKGPLYIEDAKSEQPSQNG
ncbi:MAG: LPS translocon maturation chaperone LptM [Pseudomonadales bacterium]